MEPCKPVLRASCKSRTVKDFVVQIELGVQKVCKIVCHVHNELGAGRIATQSKACKIQLSPKRPSLALRSHRGSEVFFTSCRPTHALLESIARSSLRRHHPVTPSQFTAVQDPFQHFTC